MAPCSDKGVPVSKVPTLAQVVVVHPGDWTLPPGWRKISAARKFWPAVEEPGGSETAFPRPPPLVKPPGGLYGRPGGL